MKNLKKKEEGFTIIEVLIVLAIAGLIMVIVFLAVPALQRNSRNTQRQNDASRIVAAVNECTNNNNGDLTNCNPINGSRITDYITIGDNQQLNSPVQGTALGTTDVNRARYVVNTQCDDGNVANGFDAGGGTRAFTLTYRAETSGNPVIRCIQG